MEKDRARQASPSTRALGQALESQPHPVPQIPSLPPFCCLLPLKLHF